MVTKRRRWTGHSATYEEIKTAGSFRIWRDNLEAFVVDRKDSRPHLEYDEAGHETCLPQSNGPPTGALRRRQPSGYMKSMGISSPDETLSGYQGLCCMQLFRAHSNKRRNYKVKAVIHIRCVPERYHCYGAERHIRIKWKQHTYKDPPAMTSVQYL